MICGNRGNQIPCEMGKVSALAVRLHCTTMEKLYVWDIGEHYDVEDEVPALSAHKPRCHR